MIRKPYPAYKSSGVEWLGDIPEGWACLDLKYVATANDDDWPETTAPETEILYVDIGSVDGTSGIRSKEPMLFDVSPSRARRRVANGDVIVSTVRTYLRAIAPIRDPEPNLTVSTGFAVIRPRKVNPDFLAHSLTSSYFVESVVSISTGVSYPATNPGDILNLPLPFPPEPEQTQISAFLDRETAKIDDLIAKKRELIEKLKEKRTALISHVVTKGLPPEEAAQHGLPVNPPLKPSGVPWLGDVPEHWKTIKSTRGFRVIGSGTTPKADDPDNYGGEVPWVTTSELREKVITETKQYVSDKALAEYSALKIYPLGTALIAMYGATIGRLGILGVEATLNQACCAYAHPVSLSTKFMYYWLWLRRPILISLSVGGGQPNLSQDDLRQLWIPAPDLAEQSRIVEFLDRETAKLDKLADVQEQTIEKLQEYRSALITAAVTGKIDVREDYS